METVSLATREAASVKFSCQFYRDQYEMKVLNDNNSINDIIEHLKEGY